ncbi:MAG TPA: type II secretion system major pseudopilin GspG [Bryobacteraceae bacterium]|nr:type II secretion system major pseudopilin GspG [Bryobacteraceae bacterium]
MTRNERVLRELTRRRRRQAGVTLIEMLVVVTIIALFAALVVPAMMRQADKARRVQATAQVNSFMTALGAFKLDTGVYPTTEQGLQSLRAKPEGVNNWNGPYLPKDVPTDPWGRAYIYKFPGDHGDEPDVISLGADGQAGGDGNNADIVSWKND